MLVWAPDPPDIIQIRKLIIFPEEQDGDIWGDPSDRKVGEDDSLSPSNPPEYEARCIIETEETTEPWGGVGNQTRKTIPFSLIQFEKRCGHKPGWTEIQQVESYKCIHNDSPYIPIPGGPPQLLMTFVIDKGTQIPVLTQQDTEKLGRVEITGVNRASATCQTTKANLWLPGDKHVSSPHFAVKDHNENIFGFDVLSSQTWQLMQSNIWSSHSTLTLKEIQILQCIHPTLTLPYSKTTNVPQYKSLLQPKIELLKLQLIWKQDKSTPKPTPHIMLQLITHQTFTPYDWPVWLIQKLEWRWQLTVDYWCIDRVGPDLEKRCQSWAFNHCCAKHWGTGNSTSGSAPLMDGNPGCKRYGFCDSTPGTQQGLIQIHLEGSVAYF